MSRSMNGSNFNIEQEPEPRNNVNRLSPPSVRMIQVRTPVPVLHPDTEENVTAQNEEVFLNYVYQSYRMDAQRGVTDDLQPVPGLLNFTATPMSPAAEIGRHLARIGDDINEKYADMFDGMISSLNMDADTSYDAFTNIGGRVFRDGITWGRIMILLSFGYRIAKTVIRGQGANIASFLRRIVSFVCRFFVSAQISRWIAEHGGWIASLNNIPSATTGMFALVSGLAALSVLAVITYNKFFR